MQTKKNTNGLRPWTSHVFQILATALTSKRVGMPIESVLHSCFHGRDFEIRFLQAPKKQIWGMGGASFCVGGKAGRSNSARGNPGFSFGLFYKFARLQSTAMAARIGRTGTDSPVEAATRNEEEYCFVCLDPLGENSYRIHSRDFCNGCGCGVKAYEGSLRKKSEKAYTDSLAILSENSDAWKQIIYDGWRDKASRKDAKVVMISKIKDSLPGYIWIRLIKQVQLDQSSPYVRVFSVQVLQARPLPRPPIPPSSRSHPSPAGRCRILKWPTHFPKQILIDKSKFNPARKL